MVQYEIGGATRGKWRIPDEKVTSPVLAEKEN
jgi:hypothetical protein